MREIKFRAMMRDSDFHTGKWVYQRGITYIQWCSGNGVFYGEIIPETVGQYTGLKDKNGVEIYEGDIILRKGVYYEIIWGNKSAWAVRTDNRWTDTNHGIYRPLHWLVSSGVPFDVVCNIHST